MKSHNAQCLSNFSHLPHWDIFHLLHYPCPLYSVDIPLLVILHLYIWFSYYLYSVGSNIYYLFFYDTNILWHQRVNPTKYGYLWHMTWLHMVDVGVNLLGHKINHISCKMDLEILLYSGPSESIGFISLISLAYEMYPRTNELLYFLIWSEVINKRCLLYGFE